VNEVSRSFPVPSHVDPALAIDYDFYNDERYQTAGGIPEALIQLRQEAPEVFWSSRLGGYWVVQGYEAAVDAARRTDLFTSSRMSIPPGPETPEYQRAIPLTIDPPAHTDLRRPLDLAFSPKAMAAHTDQIRALAVELIDKVAPLGACDIFTEVTEQLPVKIFMQIMGLDLSRFREFRTIAQRAISSSDPPTRSGAMGEVSKIMRELITERKKAPRNDLVSRLVQLTPNGEPICEEIVLGYCNLLFVAGLDTVANAMAFIVRHLAHDRALQERLRADPSLLTNQVVEELLRRHSVAPVGRKVTQDVEWRGVTMREGDMLLINYPGASLDEAKYDHADQVDIDRAMRFTAPTFGAGPHRCVGRHLARIEILVMLEELLKRLPTFGPDPEKTERMHGGSVLSMDELPIVWPV
jgi:cytochrome P450